MRERLLRGTIQAGMRVHVAYAGPRREPTFSALVRFVSEEFIRLDLYSLPATRLPPQRGEPVVLIAQEGDQLRALDAVVIGVDSAPPALILTPPVEARRDERRRFPRVAANIAVEAAFWLDPAGGARSLNPARVVDLSVGGWKLRARATPPLDAELYVQTELIPGQLSEVRGLVLGISPLPDSPAFYIRAAFSRIDPQTYAAIVKYVSEALAAEEQRAA